MESDPTKRPGDGASLHDFLMWRDGLHWFDRLLITSGEEQPLVIVPAPGERKRIVARRRQNESGS